MGPLRNTRHEMFVQLLLQGEKAIDAHEKAGYARDDGNATRLAKNPKVIERLSELQAEIAGKNKITVASLLDELEEARKRADSLDQLATVVQAVTAKAKISGLMAPQKLEVGGPGDFSKCETVEAVVDDLLKYSLNPSYQIATERDRHELIDMTKRHYAEMQEVLDAIKARPVAGMRVNSPTLTKKQRSANVRRYSNSGIEGFALIFNAFNHQGGEPSEDTHCSCHHRDRLARRRLVTGHAALAAPAA